MSMGDRRITFGGTDLMAEFPLYYSDFEEAEPEPKVNKVVIPAGADKDITEALGPVAFSNGTHTFKLLMHSQSLEDELRRFMALVHGQRSSYKLSWDGGFTYTGRWKVVEVEYLTNDAALVTVSVDRYPWGTRRDSVDILANPRGMYALRGNNSFEDIDIVLRQSATVTIDGRTSQYGAGTHRLADKIDHDASVIINYADWLYRIVGTNLIVNPAHRTRSGVDIDFDSNFAVVGTNLKCVNEQLQHATLRFTRRSI